MSLPKSIECNCEVVDDPDQVCPKHQEYLLQALSIAYQALEAVRFGSLEANFKQCTQTEIEIAAEAIRRIEELGLRGV